MVFLFRSAVFTVGWVALDRMPESRITPDFLMAPLRYVWSALYMHKNFFAGSAYGLLWCSLAGLLLDKTFVVACDALLQTREREQTLENAQPGIAKKQNKAKLARKLDKYLYRLARASEPARDTSRAPHRDGRTIGQELVLEGRGCRINRSLTAAYRGNPDLGEGYLLHLWTAGQVREAAARHFPDAEDLLLLKYSRAWLLEADLEICYEEVDAAAVHARDDGSEPRRGAYPHVYAGKCEHPELSYMCLVDYYRLPRADGALAVPPEAFADDREEDWDDDPSNADYDDDM